MKYAALKEVSPQVIKNDYNNLMPRLGCAWSPGLLPNTTVRAGVGMYYDVHAGLGDDRLQVGEGGLIHPHPFGQTGQRVPVR